MQIEIQSINWFIAVLTGIGFGWNTACNRIFRALSVLKNITEINEYHSPA
jgi:hypothetical protein